LRYNEENGVTPKAIVKPTREIIGYEYRGKKQEGYQGGADHPDVAADPVVQYMSIDGLEKAIEKTKREMQVASKELDFIEAARLRDEMYRLQEVLLQKNNNSKNPKSK